MWTETFTFLLQLPPLAFGPALPPRAFDLPKALVCPVRDLGRIQEPTPPWRPITLPATLSPDSLKPAQEIFLVNRPVDMLLFLAAAYAGRATWDNGTWSTRNWQATGTVTPVLVPPMAPPTWGPRPL